MPRSRSPTIVAAPTAVEMVSGTTTATGREQEHGHRVRRLRPARVSPRIALLGLAAGAPQRWETAARVDVADARDGEQQDGRDHEEEDAAEDHHRDPEVACLDELLQIGPGDGPHPARPVDGRLTEALRGRGRRSVVAAVTCSVEVESWRPPSSASTVATAPRARLRSLVRGGGCRLDRVSAHGEVAGLRASACAARPGSRGRRTRERVHEVGHAGHVVECTVAPRGRRAARRRARPAWSTTSSASGCSSASRRTTRRASSGR